MPLALTLRNITKHFTDGNTKKFLALKDISFEINAGEFFILLGPSGSGKSTLLRIMSGLEKDYQGELKLGQNITSADISFVFQQFALMPWLTVYQNIELALDPKKITAGEKKEKIIAELKRLDLEKFADSYPRELSGGMKQRVGIARALVKNPKIIFMDEPFSELDSFTAQELRSEILKIWNETKTTIVMVTHLIEEALELGDRIAILTPLPGKIEKIVPNHLPRPRAKRSADFFEYMDHIYKLIKP